MAIKKGSFGCEKVEKYSSFVVKAFFFKKGIQSSKLGIWGKGGTSGRSLSIYNFVEYTPPPPRILV